MNRINRVLGCALVLLAAPLAFVRAQQGEILTEEEQDKLRETQDPAQRIELYLAFAQTRLDRFESFRDNPAGPQDDNGASLDKLLNEYIGLNDELKNWIDFQYQRNGDMRRGLRALLQRGPQQLEHLRRIQQAPDAHASDYKETLRDAIDDLTDTLDGASKALSGQEKKFGEIKREEKAAVQAEKGRAKEEKKRTKEERKVLKRERKRRVPADSEDY